MTCGEGRTEFAVRPIERIVWNATSETISSSRLPAARIATAVVKVGFNDGKSVEVVEGKKLRVHGFTSAEPTR